MTPLDVFKLVADWIAFHWVFAWWGWWFVLALWPLVSLWFGGLCAELGINPLAFPVVVVNREEDDR